MLAGGLTGLGLGRRQYGRYRRVLASRPAMAGARVDGLVRIRGRARSEAPLSSPLTATPCCYYRVEIEQERASFSTDSATGSDPGTWHAIYKETSAPGFLIEDASGSAQVQPEGLDLDVPPLLDHEIDSEPKNQREEAFLEYLRRKSPDPWKTFLFEKTTQLLLSPEQAARPEVQERMRQARARIDRRLQRKTKRHNFRFREYCIVPGQEYEVVCVMRGNVLSKDSAGGPFLISSGSSQEMERKQLRLAWNYAGWGLGMALFGLILLLAR